MRSSETHGAGACAGGGAVLSAAEVIRLLGLAPLPREGGHFRETYRSGISLPSAALVGALRGPRSAGTAIYYLLTRETFSAFHKLKGDEVFHHYMGDPVELFRIGPDGALTRVALGPDLAAGERPQAVVLAGEWQASRLARDRVGWALLGTTMAPGFDFADYEHGGRAELLRLFPAHATILEALTTDP